MINQAETRGAARARLEMHDESPGHSQDPASVLPIPGQVHVGPSRSRAQDAFQPGVPHQPVHAVGVIRGYEPPGTQIDLR
jgi:hypothetical protein